MEEDLAFVSRNVNNASPRRRLCDLDGACLLGDSRGRRTALADKRFLGEAEAPSAKVEVAPMAFELPFPDRQTGKFTLLNLFLRDPRSRDADPEGPNFTISLIASMLPSSITELRSMPSRRK
jgi:hypothetical protein